MEDDRGRYSFRKRKRLNDGVDGVLNQLLELMASCGRLVIFSGSGLSANSGMSMFSTKNGLYERARQRFKIQDGIKLFSYSFYKQRRKDVQQFFAQIYSEAKNSKAAPGHVSIAQLHELGKLQRHYTLNIDGLAEAVGMDTWHHENNPNGITVEMHGNISYVVCPSCHAVEPLNGPVMQTMKACQPVVCRACSADEMRFKVMLYDDEEGDCITPEDVFERLDDDLAVADVVVWVGISFEQSASTEYFRKVRHMLADHGRLQNVVQVIINPSDEAYFNVLSTISKKEDVKVLDVRGTSDEVLPRVIQHLHKTLGTKPDPAYAAAAAEAAAAAAIAKRNAQAQQAAAEAAETIAAAVATAAVKTYGRRGRRTSSSSSDGGNKGQQQPMVLEVNSAAAAALALPAAVQQHILKQEQQQHLKQEPPDLQTAVVQQQQDVKQEQQQDFGAASNPPGMSTAVVNGKLLLLPEELLSAAQSSDRNHVKVTQGVATSGDVRAVAAQHQHQQQHQRQQAAGTENAPLPAMAVSNEHLQVVQGGNCKSLGLADGITALSNLQALVQKSVGVSSPLAAAVAAGAAASLQAALMQEQQQQQGACDRAALLTAAAGSAGANIQMQQQQQQRRRVFTAAVTSPLERLLGAGAASLQAALAHHQQQQQQQQQGAVVNGITLQQLQQQRQSLPAPVAANVGSLQAVVQQQQQLCKVNSPLKEAAKPGSLASYRERQGTVHDAQQQQALPISSLSEQGNSLQAVAQVVQQQQMPAPVSSQLLLPSCQKDSLQLLVQTLQQQGVQQQQTSLPLLPEQSGTSLQLLLQTLHQQGAAQEQQQHRAYHNTSAPLAASQGNSLQLLLQTLQQPKAPQQQQQPVASSSCHVHSTQSFAASSIQSVAQSIQQQPQQHVFASAPLACAPENLQAAVQALQQQQQQRHGAVYNAR